MADAQLAVPRRNLRRNLSDQVAGHLGTRILSGAYTPGETLPEEPLLCSEFDVSRTVIREAVRLLISKGMLEVRPRVGTRVQDPRNWQLLDRDVLAWQQSITLQPDQLSDLIELRQVVEPDAARLAAERRTGEDLEVIRLALQKMEQSVANNSEYAIADAQFHIAILRAARNRYFDTLESAIFAGLLLSIRVTNPDEHHNRKSVPLHKAIAEAIGAQDPETAYGSMKVHLSDSARRLRQNLA